MKRDICWVAHERYDEKAELNLICFPYAGGSASFFAPFKRSIDKTINLCPVLYPGREKNAGVPNFNSIEETAQAFVDANPWLFEKRYALLGHCTGALMAYEVALAAEKDYGAAPCLFFASSAPAPCCEQFFQKDRISGEELTERMIESGMIDRDFAEGEAFSTYYLPLLQEDLKMHTKYTPQQPYSQMKTRAVVLYGDEDPLLQNPDAIHGWNRFAEYGVASVAFPGGHFYLSSCREQVGQAICHALSEERFNRI